MTIRNLRKKDRARVEARIAAGQIARLPASKNDVIEMNPESAVGQPLKEAWLALRQAAESTTTYAEPDA